MTSYRAFKVGYQHNIGIIILQKGKMTQLDQEVGNCTAALICSVNVVCADATAMLFRSAISLTVWQA